MIEELRNIIIDFLSTEDRGFFVDEVVTEIYSKYEQYSLEDLEVVIGRMLKKEILVTNKEKDILYLNN
jgi:predicted transcriptional regulator